MPMCKNQRHPWKDPLPITKEMTKLAGELISNHEDTDHLIEEVEGPTEAEVIAWNAEVADIMEGIDWR